MVQDFIRILYIIAYGARVTSAMIPEIIDFLKYRRFSGALLDSRPIIKFGPRSPPISFSSSPPPSARNAGRTDGGRELLTRSVMYGSS